jgi:phosphoribosylformimino-5-aminoimidazole carboxamide ribotide isomerase
MPLLYPSIDLRGGRVVRLAQGDFDRETVYDPDPAEIAAEFCAGGARWIHVVDLDAARSGVAANRDAVAAIVAAASGKAWVQVGGGVRSRDSALGLADLGVARVVIGSAAIADPDLVGAVSEHVPAAVALDHRAGIVAVHGWTEQSETKLVDALGRFAAAAAFVITDIERDGLLGGPDVDGISAAVTATATPVIASGGVGSLDDLRGLAGIDGLHGVITGRALYEGRFTVSEAIGMLG